MTEKEALNILRNESAYHPMYMDAFAMAIEALERSLCGEAISRKEAIVSIRALYPGMPMADLTGHRRLEWSRKYSQYLECEKAIMALPPVTPTPKDDVLDKIRSEIEKAVWEDAIVSLDRTDEIRIPRLDPDDVFEIIDKYKADKGVEK